MQYNMELERRIHWVDVLRFLGMWAIFIGHFGESVGNLFPFVWIYHVPLFFFASGLFAIPKKTSYVNFMFYVKKKFMHLMLPYFFFSILSIIVTVLFWDKTPNDIVNMLKQCLFGLKENTYAEPLWFFPALFTMSIVFEFLRRQVKNKYVLFLICLLIFLSLPHLAPYFPVPWTEWVYCTGYALSFIVYYAIGALCSSVLLNFSYSNLTAIQKTTLSVVSMVLIIYAAGIYYGKDYVILYANEIKIISLIYPIAKVMALIWVNVLVAMLLSSIKLLQQLGQETLYMCGNELIVKICTVQIFGLVGLEIHVNNELMASIYSFLLMCIVLFLLIPFEKELYSNALKFIKTSFSTPKG